jgi:hypothetical protein
MHVASRGVELSSARYAFERVACVATMVERRLSISHLFTPQSKSGVWRKLRVRNYNPILEVGSRGADFGLIWMSAWAHDGTVQRHMQGAGRKFQSVIRMNGTGRFVVSRGPRSSPLGIFEIPGIQEYSGQMHKVCTEGMLAGYPLATPDNPTMGHMGIT